MSRFVTRNLSLKRVHFNAGNRKNFQAPPIENMLREVNRQSQSWTTRHWPPPPDPGSDPIQSGTRCLYISRFAERTTGAGDGVYFEVGSYVLGQGADQIKADFSAAEPHVQSGPIEGRDGEQRSILHLFRCVALGETLIVQNERGGGGIPALRKLLTYVFRNWAEPRLPAVHLVDVTSSNLRREIVAGGGIELLRVQLIDGGQAPDDSDGDDPATPLYEARNVFPGARTFKAEWIANGDSEIDLDQALDAYNEAEQGESVFDKVEIKTRTAGWIKGLGKYKARKELQVTVDGHGLEHVSEIKVGLFEYLDELRLLGEEDWRLIDDDGYFQRSEPLDLTSE